MEWDILAIDEAHEGVGTYKTDVTFDRIKRKFTLHYMKNQTRKKV